MLSMIGLSAGALAATPATPTAAGPVPVESFARLPAIRGVNISRDGQYVAYTVVADLQSAFAFKNLVTGTINGVEGSLYVAASSPRWVSRDRVVYGNNRSMASIDRDGGKYSGLLGAAREQDKRDQNQLYIGGIIFSRFAGDKEGNVLMLEYDHPLDGGRYGLVRLTYPNVINMDTRTGNYFRVIQNPGKVIGWLADGQGVVRVGVEYDQGLSRVIYRASDGAPWQVLAGLDYAKRTVGLHGLSTDGSTLYLSLVTPDGTWGIYTYNLVKQQLGDLILSHEHFDILPLGRGSWYDRIIFAPNTREILGIQYDSDTPKVIWFDPQMAAIQGALDHGLKHRVNTIVDMSDDLRKLVVLSWSAKDPGTYYIFDLDKKELKPLFATMPWIKPEQMADVYPISYKSRDGLVIHGYLTVPPGKEPQDLPLVVFPHGGPFGRDTWGFHSDPQFLASRGYAVLQMNYRGSPGFGESFFEKGHRHIGRELQDDITDGTRWAIKQGIADPHRIAIMGWSFGGYSVLMGLTREPDLYRCGIDLAGVTDWRAILNYDLEISKFGKEEMADLLGDPGKDAADLDEISPVNHVDKIRAPLLFVYSKDDTTVPFEQARLLRDALDKAHKPYEFVSKFNEGHGFYTYDHRVELYQRIEKFLAENMK
jgi:dipeptidyl aminopeptidase/acylaminoacyl peptidase